MQAFIPDIPYHIQGVFVVTFAWIWSTAFYGDKDYLQPMPTDEIAYTQTLKANTWRAIISIILFMLAFAYVKPYTEFRLSDVF